MVIDEKSVEGWYYFEKGENYQHRVDYHNSAGQQWYEFCRKIKSQLLVFHKTDR